MSARLRLWAVAAKGRAAEPYCCFGPKMMLLVFEHEADAKAAARRDVTGLHPEELVVVVSRRVPGLPGARPRRHRGGRGVSRALDSSIESIVHDLTLVIRRCEAIGLGTVAERLTPIRDAIAEGLRQRRARAAASLGDTPDPNQGGPK